MLAVSLRSNMLQWTRRVVKISRVILSPKMLHVGLLYVVVPSLALGKLYSRLLGVKLQLCSLHVISTGLVTN